MPASWDVVCFGAPGAGGYKWQCILVATFLVRHVSYACRAYALSMMSVHQSVTLVNCDHIVQKMCQSAHDRIGQSFGYLRAKADPCHSFRGTLDNYCQFMTLVTDIIYEQMTK